MKKILVLMVVLSLVLTLVGAVSAQGKHFEEIRIRFFPGVDQKEIPLLQLYIEVQKQLKRTLAVRLNMCFPSGSLTGWLHSSKMP